MYLTGDMLYAFRPFHYRVIMDMSVESTVSAALSLQGINAAQNQQNVLLRKVLDNQAQAIASLMDTMPKLSTFGPVGTQLHVTA